MANTKKYRASGISIPSAKIADVPDAPTIGTATDVGTSRAFNNGAATVAYTGAATGGTATTFTATSTPGSFTATGTSPITVTGLQSATSYTFTVTPSNSTGTGSASSSSSSITATTVPQAPTIGTASDGGTGTTATVAYTAGATGGAAVSAYTATSSPGGFTGTGASPITVSGLTAGTAYTFTVTATNAQGTSAASSASNSVTPTSFNSIATITTSGLSSYTFSSIPQGYSSLQLRSSSYYTGSAQFNGDSTSGNYSRHDWLFNSIGFPTWAYAITGTQSSFLVYGHGSVMDIYDYSSTSKLKVTRELSSTDDGTNGVGATLTSNIWKSTSAITSITISITTSSSGDTFSLYGVK